MTRGRPTASITVSEDVAEQLAGRVQSGKYGSASDVIREGLQALDDREGEFERWVRDEVLPGHAEYMADPSQAVRAEDILDRLKAERGAAD